MSFRNGKTEVLFEILQSANTLSFLSGAVKRHITLRQPRVGGIRGPAFAELSALNHHVTKTPPIKQA